MYEWADDTHGPGPDSSGVWECAWEIEAGLPLRILWPLMPFWSFEIKVNEMK